MIKISIKQSGQGLFSVDIDNKPSLWKIGNTKGVWNLYRSEPNYLKIDEDLAKIIHKDELNVRVAELIMTELKEKAKEIFSDHKYNIVYSNSKAIARYQLLDGNGNWSNDFSEKVFDTKAQASEFLKEKNLEHARTLIMGEM